MNLLQSYGDSDNESEQQPSSSSHQQSSLITLNTAPNVKITENNLHIIPKGSTSLVFNPKINELYSSSVGPQENPFSLSKNEKVNSSFLNGELNDHHMHSFLFNSNYYNYGITKDTLNKEKKNRKRKKDNNESNTSASFVSSNSEEKYVDVDENFNNPNVMEGFEDFITDTIEEEDDQLQLKLRQEMEEERKKRKKQIEEELKKSSSGEKKEKVQNKLLEIEYDETYEKKTTTEGQEGYSIYHLHREEDYQGRTFMSPPSHLKPLDYTEKKAVLPKKLIHTYHGHEKEKMITAIEFFPEYGHLLLSCSMDSTIKIWDVLSHRSCIRTYVGHTKAVRSINFSREGDLFASCSYDKKVKIWDVETGKIIQTLSSGSTPYIVKFNPSEQRSNELIVGYSNNKILQFDVRSGKVIHKYDRHTASVNSLTFVDGGKKFVSSSDDKTLRLWEYNVPVEIKKLSDPELHSMPYIETHPNGKWVIAQSLNNQILTFEAQTRLKQQQNKTFKGHQIAGYSCQTGFSNDSKYVFSGDYSGNVWFWDWKDAKQIKKMKCHEGICIGCVWHPIDRSLFATCGSDSVIKLFQ
ncbi:hypothetical protein ABK040_010095 [Willaertia magna]